MKKTSYYWSKLTLQVPSRRFNEVEKGQQIEREEGAEGTKTEGQAV